MEADVKEVAFVELEGCRPIAECNRGYVSEGTYQGKKVAIKHITLSVIVLHPTHANPAQQQSINCLSRTIGMWSIQATR